MGKQDQLQDFQAFNFDQDTRFQTWVQSVETVGNDPATQLRLKAKWYKKTIDVNFDLAWLVDLLNKPPPSSTFGSARSTQFQSQPAPTASSSGSTRSSGPPPSSWQSRSNEGQTQTATGPAVGTSVERYIFIYHVMVVILSAVHVGAIFMPSLSLRAYRMFLQIVVIGQGLKLFTSYPPRALWPFSWPNTKAYLTTIVPTSYLHYLIIAIAFGSHPPITLLMVPIAIHGLYAAMNRLSRTHGQHALWQKYGAKMYTLLQSKERDAQSTAAFSEVAVGFVMILSLLGRNRNFLLTFVYWNTLKMRYHLGDTAAQHRMAWWWIGQQTAPLRARVPLLEKPIAMATNWFLSVR